MDTQIGVRMSEQEAKRLRSLARRKGCTVSEMVRELIASAELVPVRETKLVAKVQVRPYAQG